MVNNPETQAKAIEMPNLYGDSSESERELFDVYVKKRNRSPEVVCASYQYTPSNYSRDEINAHTETLKACDKGLFKMNSSKVSFYNREIKRYLLGKEKSEKYEYENNLNAEGYEN